MLNFLLRECERKDIQAIILRDRGEHYEKMERFIWMNMVEDRQAARQLTVTCVQVKERGDWRIPGKKKKKKVFKKEEFKLA